jgi:hypothetical protein
MTASATPGSTAPLPPPARLQEEVDARGDYIFRFELKPHPDPALTLSELYRQHLHDLLGVVRFHADGRPVVVNAFSFLNAPDEIVPILPDRPPDGRA